MKGILKNFSISFIANLVTVSVSLVVTLILPKFLNIEQYGYWQVYLFYTTYVGVLHFGFNDGIYLRYGGEKYSKLNFKLFNSEYKMLISVEFLLAVVITVISLFQSSLDYKCIWISLAICMFLTNVRYLYIYILQATNRIKEFAIVTIADRTIFFVVIFIFVSFGLRNFFWIIIADLLGRSISMLIGMYYCKEIIILKGKWNSTVKQEIKKNIIAGSQLLFANLASSCIIGIVRYGIQKSWDVSVFGKVSFMLSISNFFVIFINTMGIVVYPNLRRINEEKRVEWYNAIESLLDAGLIATLVLYYPIIIIIKWWLPQYSDFLEYICMLFPIYIFEGKMALLYNTYLKVYRKEGAIFKINICFVIISTIFTLITTLVLKNLNTAVMSMLFLIVGRCVISQIYLAKMLDVKYIKNIVINTLVIIIYLVIGLNLEGVLAAISMICMILLYEIVMANRTRAAIKLFKKSV